MPNLNKSSEADKWAETIIASWQTIKKHDIPESASKWNDFVIEIKTFLSSLPPRIKKEAHVKQILETLKELKELQLTKNLEPFIPHFIIHQLRFFEPYYLAEAETFEIKYTPDDIIDSLQQPFKSKHLKNDCSYLSKKLIDYSFLFNEDQSTEFC